MRCFIAAWPDEPTRQALAALSDDVRARVEHRRATSVADLHVTLAFIGSLADDDALAVANAVAKLRFKPFQWQLDSLGFFREAGVVWAGADVGNAKSLLRLADRLRNLLDQTHIDYDRRPLAPHVTLLRGVRRFSAEHIAPPIAWLIGSIALYRSVGGRGESHYSRVL